MPGSGVEAAMKKVADWQASIEDVRQLTFDFNAKLHPRMAEVIGKPAADRMWDGGKAFVATAYSGLQEHVTVENATTVIYLRLTNTDKPIRIDFSAFSAQSRADASFIEVGDDVAIRCDCESESEDTYEALSVNRSEP